MSDYLEDEGYPTKEALKIIEKWDKKDIKGLFEFIKNIWWQADWGWEEKLNKEGFKEYHISTGGWSGNEDIIGALCQNLIVWHYTWEQSRAGGHYIFKQKEENK